MKQINKKTTHRLFASRIQNIKRQEGQRAFDFAPCVGDAAVPALHTGVVRSTEAASRLPVGDDSASASASRRGCDYADARRREQAASQAASNPWISIKCRPTGDSLPRGQSQACPSGVGRASFSFFYTLYFIYNIKAAYKITLIDSEEYKSGPEGHAHLQPPTYPNKVSAFGTRKKNASRIAGSPRWRRKRW
jgi:hypothetical protein